jgi:DNA-binding transcriptional LysR family regulator
MEPNVDLDLNLLAVFDAILRERSVTKAAQELGLTQGAMSHSLNRLRSYFDDQLFVKTGQGMVPTQRAEALSAVVTRIMEDVRRGVLSQATFDPGRAQRTFTLCMTDMGELVFLPPLIRHLRAEAPLCNLRTLQVPVQQVESMLASGEADVAVGSIRAAPQDLFQQLLFTHSFVTIVSTRNDEVGEEMSLEQFQRMPQIVVALSNKVGAAYDSAFDEQGISRNIFLQTPHFLIVPLLIEQHPDLIATVPLDLASVFAKYGTVRIVRPPVTLPRFALKQHWHSRFHHDPAIIWLRETMKKSFENHPNMLIP